MNPSKIGQRGLKSEFSKEKKLSNGICDKITLDTWLLKGQKMWAANRSRATHIISTQLVASPFTF